MLIQLTIQTYSIPSGTSASGSRISFHTENLSFHYSALLTEILSLNTADPNFKQEQAWCIHG